MPEWMLIIFFSHTLPQARAQAAKRKCGLENLFLVIVFQKPLHVQILYNTIECTLGELNQQGTGQGLISRNSVT